MCCLIECVVDEVDVCLFVVDVWVGVILVDEYFVDILCKCVKYVILVVNKVEGCVGELGVMEVYVFGLGELLCIFVEYGEGMDDLYCVLVLLVEQFEVVNVQQVLEIDIIVLDDEDDDESWCFSVVKFLQVVVIGCLNVGKLMLINKILGEDRLLIGFEVGIICDLISVSVDFMGMLICIFDIVGMCKKVCVMDKLEKLLVLDGLCVVCFVEVVVVLLDVGILFEQQDLCIVDFVEIEGCVVVIVVNKWDLEEDKFQKLNELCEVFECLLLQLKGVFLVIVLVCMGKGLDWLYNVILKVYEVWNCCVLIVCLN